MDAPPAEARTPAAELVARRLLVPRGSGQVVVPGEVGLALRGGRTTAEPVAPAPPLATSARNPALVARTAAGAALEAVRRVDLLLDTWGVHPPAVLRSGGLAVRDLKATAALLHLDETTTALVIEVASAAGLLAEGPDPADAEALRPDAVGWLPTILATRPPIVLVTRPTVPALRRLEAYRLDRGVLRQVARHEGDAVCALEPFAETSLELAALWE